MHMSSLKWRVVKSLHLWAGGVSAGCSWEEKNRALSEAMCIKITWYDCCLWFSHPWNSPRPICYAFRTSICCGRSTSWVETVQAKLLRIQTKLFRCSIATVQMSESACTVGTQAPSLYWSVLLDSTKISTFSYKKRPIPSGMPILWSEEIQYNQAGISSLYE